MLFKESHKLTRVSVLLTSDISKFFKIHWKIGKGGWALSVMEVIIVRSTGAVPDILTIQPTLRPVPDIHPRSTAEILSGHPLRPWNFTCCSALVESREKE